VKTLHALRERKKGKEEGEKRREKKKRREEKRIEEKRSKEKHLTQWVKTPHAVREMISRSA
jgi:hypothetical protein